VDDYLGRVAFAGKRVLELGTASGFLCFTMERQGADVVAFDIAPDQLWDFFPSPHLTDLEGYISHGLAFSKRLHNSYWFAHRAHRSDARVVYGNIYQVPAEIGPVDIATYGCILLHLRDPFLALANGLRLAREQVIITQPLHGPFCELLLGRNVQPGPTWRPRSILHRAKCRAKAMLGLPAPAAPRPAEPAPAEMVPCQVFLPDPTLLSTLPRLDVINHVSTWWAFTPRVLQGMVGSLGFERSHVTYHDQFYQGKRHPMYTIVAERTRPMPRRIDGGYPWF
jgi:hypothetical protein